MLERFYVARFENKVKSRKAKKKVVKKLTTSSSKPKKKYTHHPDHDNTSESYLIENKSEDLQEAWFKIREFGQSLGEQRIYASGKAIMFSKKVCYFFVRPKKTFLEVVVFNKNVKPKGYFSSVKPVTKTKWAHTFKLIHADQVEGILTDAIAEAFEETPEN